MQSRYTECLGLLDRFGILAKLRNFSPEFVGSIPIQVDLPRSDIDIVCTIGPGLMDALESFSRFSEFKLSERDLGGVPSIVCRFLLNNEKVEIVSQPIQSRKQISFLHLEVEKEILRTREDAFRLKVIEEKKKGKSTEEAFAGLLELQGDPYSSLIDYGREIGVWS